MATVNGEAILSVDDLRISFSTYAGEVQAVRGATFDLRRGETLAIVGESGSGKSVAARSIMRLNPESNTIVRGGEIIFDGEDLLKLSEKRMLDVRGPKGKGGDADRFDGLLLRPQAYTPRNLSVYNVSGMPRTSRAIQSPYSGWRLCNGL